MHELDINSTLTEFADDNGTAPSVLMELGIDVSLHAKDTLGRIAQEYALDAHQLLEAVLMPTLKSREDQDTDWSERPLEQLCDYVVATHHAFLRRQIPLLRLLIAKVQHDRGAMYAALPQIVGYISQLAPELDQHLRLEEEILFPEIRELAWASRQPGAPAERVDRPIADLGHDYEETVHEIIMLRRATDGYHAPADAPTAYQALMQELSNLEADLERHAYLENEILFPRAIALEKELRDS